MNFNFKEIMKDKEAAFFIIIGLITALAHFIIPDELITEILYLTISTFSVFVLFTVIKFYGKTGTEGKVWLAVFAGFILWNIGEYMWVIYESVLDIEPFPSPADLFYLAGYVGFGYGFYYKFLKSGAVLDDKAKLISLAGILLILVPSILFVFGPIIADDELSAAETFVTAAYPVLDIFIIIPALLMISGSYTGSPVSKGWWKVITLGMFSWAFADILYNALYIAEIEVPQINLLWLVAYVLVSYGALCQKRIHQSLIM